jgi:hypothetical protein
MAAYEEVGGTETLELNPIVVRFAYGDTLLTRRDGPPGGSNWFSMILW